MKINGNTCLNFFRLLRIGFLRNIFIIAAIFTIILPICIILFINPAFTSQLTKNTENEAIRVGKHLMSTIITDQTELTHNFPIDEVAYQIKEITTDFGLMKLKLFSKSGKNIFSTDSKDVGKINEKAYFHNIVAQGKIYTKFVQKDKKSSEDQIVPADVVETYVPIIKGDQFIGAFEIYYDITARTQNLKKLLFFSTAVFSFVAISLFGAIIVIIIKAGENIVERAQTEEALRESEKRYRMLFEKAGDAIFILATDGAEAGTIVAANQAAAEMHGYSVAELLELNIRDLDTPEAAETAPSLIQRILKGEWIKREITHRRKDGTVFSVEISAGLLELKNKKYILAFDRDITKRRAAEEGLLKSHDKLERHVAQRTAELDRTNEQLRQEIEDRKRAEKRKSQALSSTKTILESMPFGVVVVGKDKKIRMVNRAALKMMKAESSQGIVNHICHNRICPALMNECPILDLGQTVDSSEKILIDHRGKNIPILKTVLPIDLEGEEVLLEAFVDISELKKTEAELQVAKESAEAANRTKSDFLANMSHELRTPLNHIIGFTEMVVDQAFGDLNETQEEYLNDALTSSKHLLSLINDILDLSKVEAGKLELNSAELNLQLLLENSLILIKEKAMRHNIQLSADIKKAPAIISADERKFKQIIYNLLSNAAKFTPDGGTIQMRANLTNCSMMNTRKRNSSLRFSAAGVKPNLNWVQISVQDTGIGIKQEDLNTIFNPFEQVDNSAGRNYQGTGLGLFLTRSLVELHGGKVWAESDGEGSGSTFSFIVPA